MMTEVMSLISIPCEIHAVLNFPLIFKKLHYEMKQRGQGLRTDIRHLSVYEAAG